MDIRHLESDPLIQQIVKLCPEAVITGSNALVAWGHMSREPEDIDIIVPTKAAMRHIAENMTCGKYGNGVVYAMPSREWYHLWFDDDDETKVHVLVLPDAPFVSIFGHRISTPEPIWEAKEAYAKDKHGYPEKHKADIAARPDNWRARP